MSKLQIKVGSTSVTVNVLDVRPRQALPYSPHDLPRHAKLFCQAAGLLAALFYGSGFAVAQDPIGVQHPESVSPLSDLVAHVVECGAKKQVVGANANCAIAPMADHHAGRYRSSMNLPRKAMGLILNDADPLVAADVEHSVAAAAYSAKPLPATRIGFFHIRPESFCSAQSTHAASPLAVNVTTTGF